MICTIAGTGMSIFDGDGRPALETSFYFPHRSRLRSRRAAAHHGLEQPASAADERRRDDRHHHGPRPIEGFPTDGALASETPLHHASDVEFDASWNLYVAGDHVPVVFRVGTDDRVFTVAGTADYGYDGDGKPALQALLSVPFGVLPDCVGRLLHQRRRRQRRALRRSPGDHPHGGRDRSSRDTRATAMPPRRPRCAGPSRLQIGPDGALYFCETRNHVVRRVSSGRNHRAPSPAPASAAIRATASRRRRPVRFSL